MKYFDAHLGLPNCSRKGMEALLRHVQNETGMVGANLILNTKKEVDTVLRYLEELPPTINIIPYYTPDFDAAPELKRSGWFKIHPRLQGFERHHIKDIVDTILSSPMKPKGMVVCCFPWGPEIKHNISLELVLELAKALPKMPVLATHAGGYESWQFRSHAGKLRNVFFDFSATMTYYYGSDLLRPLQRYLLHSSDRILFGSDWPTGNIAQHIAEYVRLAAEVSVSREEVERMLLSNAERLWPQMFRSAQAGETRLQAVRAKR